MNADAAVPHVIADGRTVFLRAGDPVQIRSGRHYQRATVVSPVARYLGRSAVRVEVHYTTRAPRKTARAVTPDLIVATDWETTVPPYRRQR